MKPEPSLAVRFLLHLGHAVLVFVGGVGGIWLGLLGTGFYLQLTGQLGTGLHSDKALTACLLGGFFGAFGGFWLGLLVKTWLLR